MVQATEEAESSARKLSDGSVAGLSGLSELMEHEPAVASLVADAEANQLPPVAKAIKPGSGPRTAEQARRDARRRNARMLYVLAGLLGLAMAGLGGLLWWAQVTDRDVSLPPPTAEELPISGHDAAMVAALPLLTASAMPDVRWEPMDEPYRFQPRTSEALLKDEQRIFLKDGREYYTATITANGAQIVTAATLRLVLVDMTDRAVAAGFFPVALFGGGKQQKVRVAFPKDLPSGLLRVDSWVEVEERMPTGQFLSKADVRPVAPGSRTLLRLRASNEHGLTLYGTQVVVRALDDNGATMGRFTLSVPWPIEPGMQLAVRLALPPPGLAEAPMSWVADAAASAVP